MAPAGVLSTFSGFTRGVVARRGFVMRDGARADWGCLGGGGGGSALANPVSAIA